MTNHLSTWVFFDDAGVSNTLHSRNICLCEKSSNIFGKTQDSNAGMFSKKGGSCDAERIIEAFKTLPVPADLMNELIGWIYVVNCLGRNLSVKKCKDQATKMKKNAEKFKTTLEELGFKELLLSYPTQSNTSTQSDTNPITMLAAKFFKDVCSYPTIECYFCLRMTYKTNAQRVTINQNIVKLFEKYETLVRDEEKLACKRCVSNLKTNKILPTYRKNNMELPPCPEEILRLSDMELQIISLVRPYQKIFNLREGRGQKAVKGSCIYFAQSVEDVVEQLPIRPDDSGIMIVSENLENIQRTRQLQIRPAYIYEALQWLKVHNKLYANVQVMDRDFTQYHSSYLSPRAVCHVDIQPEDTQTPIQLGAAVSVTPDLPCLSVEFAATNGFRTITEDKKILRGGFHQGSISIFRGNSIGVQCTAMASVFLAKSLITPIHEWDQTTLDETLLLGDKYYQKVYPLVSASTRMQSRYLEATDCNGELEINGTFVKINVLAHFAYEFSGMLDEGFELLSPQARRENQHLKLRNRLQNFIDSDHTRAIGTARGYSFGLLKEHTKMYYFDSHSKGACGRNASDGKSCVIQFSVDNGAKLLSQLININLRGRIQQNMTSQQRESEMVITITPVICFEANQSDSRMETTNLHENLELGVDSDADVDMESSDSEMEQYSNSHPNKIVTPTSLQTLLSQMTDPEPMDCDQNSSNFGLILQSQLNNIPGAEEMLMNIHTLEHVAIHCDDYIEPSAKDFINGVRNRHRNQNLYRKTGPPIPESYADHLDELSFIKCYPTGTHGFGFPRDERITILDYCQSLLQRGDRRFQDPDFIFYCLSRVETYKLSQMCNIVSDLETEGPADRLLDD